MCEEFRLIDSVPPMLDVVEVLPPTETSLATICNTVDNTKCTLGSSLRLLANVPLSRPPSSTKAQRSATLKQQDSPVCLVSSDDMGSSMISERLSIFENFSHNSSTIKTSRFSHDSSRIFAPENRISPVCERTLHTSLGTPYNRPTRFHIRMKAQCMHNTTNSAVNTARAGSMNSVHLLHLQTERD